MDEKANAPLEPEISAPDPDWSLAHVKTKKGLSRARDASTSWLSVVCTAELAQRTWANDGDLDYYNVNFNPRGSLG